MFCEEFYNIKFKRGNEKKATEGEKEGRSEGWVGRY